MSKVEEIDWRVKTYKNDRFITSPQAREVRVLCEMTAPKIRYEQEGIKNTIVFFGSARALPAVEAQAEYEKVQKEINQSPTSRELERKLALARSKVKLSRYYEDAVTLASELTKWSLGILQPERKFYVCSGGGPGMMEAANRGAHQAGGNSVGLNISLPFEQHPNDYQTPKLSFEFHYFFVRKYWFANLAKALIVFPGGFGTMDELFELLTLIQTGKSPRIPVILFGKDFWEKLINFDLMVDWGLVSHEDMELFSIMDDPLEAAQTLIRYLTEHHL